MKQITLFFALQVLTRNSGLYIFKVPPRDDKWMYKWTKGIEG